MAYSLEFRNKDGNYLFGLKGEFAERVYKHLVIEPEFIKTTRKIRGKGEFVILECVLQFGALYANSIEIVLSPGDYIKIVNE